MATSNSVNGPSFLYPFLDAMPLDEAQTPQHSADKSTKHPTETLFSNSELEELAAAARVSWTTGEELDKETVIANELLIDEAARLIVESTLGFGRVFVIGNGGSACDAQRFVRLLQPSVAVSSLMDSVVITALANDVGADRIFDRQIETFAKSQDVVVAFSTSGTSTNVLSALARARRKGAFTIVFAGYGGAALTNNPDVDVCLAVDSSSVHRIQEAQGALTLTLADRVGMHLEVRRGTTTDESARTATP